MIRKVIQRIEQNLLLQVFIIMAIGIAAITLLIVATIYGPAIDQQLKNILP